MQNLLIVTQKVDKNDQLLGFFIEWISRFAGKFEKITVLCLEKGEFNLPQNVQVVSLGKDRGSGKLKQLFTFYFLLFTLRRDYDAIFVHMNPIWVVLGGPIWRLIGKKLFFWYTSGGVTFKLKLAEKFANVIFTASKESFRLPSKKVIITGHGIDTEFFKPNATLNLPIRQDQGPEFIEGQPSTPNPRLLSVGRIAPVKNYETLIDAAKILKDKGLDFIVTMVGEAPLDQDKIYEQKIRLQITNYKLQDYFNFVGKVNHKDLPAYYQSHDIFIHLSKTGSVDKTLLEAMACGMRVLSSNDSARTFLSQSLLFEENDPSGLAGKIMAIAEYPVDEKLREYVVQNHNLDKLIDKLSAIMAGN